MTHMFKNYLVTSWRNLLKSKGRSFLNIAGLAPAINDLALGFKER
jgi:hypothetical protein